MDKKPTLSESVLKAIEEKEVKQLPAWWFLLKNVLFWVVFAVALGFGARSVAVIIFGIVTVDLPTFMAAKPEWHEAMRLLPVMWLVLFSLLVILAVLGIHHTHKGYKISVPVLVLGNLLCAIGLGVGLYVLGDGPQFEKDLSHAMHFYEPFEKRKENLWSKPRQGRLAGEIIFIEDNDILVIDDFGKATWKVYYQDARIKGPVEIEVGEKIRIIGRPLDKQEFKAQIISSWRVLPMLPTPKPLPAN